MEGIEKALEKARRQRREPADPTAITYGRTRVQPVSPRTLRDKRVIAGFSHDPTADIFRVLRTQLLKRLEGDTHTTLGITSPNPSEGKSLVAVNLAVSLALDVSRTVLLVDLDLRRPDLHRYFRVKPEPGLRDHLLGDVDLADCLINPGIERLVILPAGDAVENSSEVLASPKMTALARELKRRYSDRFVIYDLPPLLSSDDALVFLSQVDACLMVVEEGRTRGGDIQHALDLLKDSNLMGTVLNKVTEDNLLKYY